MRKTVSLSPSHPACLCARRRMARYAFQGLDLSSQREQGVMDHSHWLNSALQAHSPALKPPVQWQKQTGTVTPRNGRGG